MTASQFLKKALATHRSLLFRTTEVRKDLNMLLEIAKRELAELDEARESVVDELVDARGKVDERDYDTVEGVESMSLPTEDDLRGITEALTDDWDEALARWKSELDNLAKDVETAKRARR